MFSQTAKHHYGLFLKQHDSLYMPAKVYVILNRKLRVRPNCKLKCCMSEVHTSRVVSVDEEGTKHIVNTSKVEGTKITGF